MTRAARSSRQAIAVAVAGVAAAGAVWFALAMATGLIFHLMPAGPPLLGGVLLRRGGKVPGARAATVIGAGTIVTVVVALALDGLGRPLDDPPWTFVVLGIGVALGAVISRWPPHPAPVE